MAIAIIWRPGLSLGDRSDVVRGLVGGLGECAAVECRATIWVVCRTTWLTRYSGAYRELFHFKPRFIQRLELASAVYPGANVQVLPEGVVLKPSSSPVRKISGSK